MAFNARDASPADIALINEMEQREREERIAVELVDDLLAAELAADLAAELAAEQVIAEELAAEAARQLAARQLAEKQKPKKFAQCPRRESIWLPSQKASEPALWTKGNSLFGLHRGTLSDNRLISLLPSKSSWMFCPFFV